MTPPSPAPNGRAAQGDSVSAMGSPTCQGVSSAVVRACGITGW